SRRHPTSTLFPYTTLFRSTDRPPCLITGTPAAAATRAEPVDRFNERERSPPVPTTSTASDELPIDGEWAAPWSVSTKARISVARSEEHTSELQSRENIVCR